MTARTVQDGVIDRDIIFRQTQAALAMLRAAAPDPDRYAGAVFRQRGTVHLSGGTVRATWRWCGFDAHPDHTALATSIRAIMRWPSRPAWGPRATDRFCCPPGSPLRKSSMWGCGTGSGMRLKVRQRMYGIAQVSKEERTDNSDAVRRWRASACLLESGRAFGPGCPRPGRNRRSGEPTPAACRWNRSSGLSMLSRKRRSWSDSP